MSDFRAIRREQRGHDRRRDVVDRWQSRRQHVVDLVEFKERVVFVGSRSDDVVARHRRPGLMNLNRFAGRQGVRHLLMPDGPANLKTNREGLIGALVADVLKSRGEGDDVASVERGGRPFDARHLQIGIRGHGRRRRRLRGVVALGRAVGVVLKQPVLTVRRHRHLKVANARIAVRQPEPVRTSRRAARGNVPRRARIVVNVRVDQRLARRLVHHRHVIVPVAAVAPSPLLKSFQPIVTIAPDCNAGSPVTVSPDTWRSGACTCNGAAAETLLSS